MHDIKSYLAKAGHGFHTGTAGVHDDGQQQRQAHSNTDTADPADGHLQCTCNKGTLHDEVSPICCLAGAMRETMKM